MSFNPRSINLVERVVTLNKVYALQWKEGGLLQITDRMGASGEKGLISKEGAQVGV